MRRLFDRLARAVRGSLARKLLLAAATVQLVILAALLVNTGRVFDAHIDEHSRQRARELDPVLEASLAPGLFRRDFEGTQDLLAQLQRESAGAIEYLVVYDDRDRIFASAGTVPFAAPGPDGIRLTGSHRTLELTRVLRMGPDPVGKLRYGLSLASIDDARRGVLRQAAVIAALAVLANLAVLALIARWLTRDLGRLVSRTHAVAAGDYDVVVGVDGDDEIGRLARDFEVMSVAVRARTEQLQERERQILALNSELERRVASRTAELVAANRELESFVSSVSHDLRSPLRGIDGLLKLLDEREGERLGEGGRDLLRRVRAGAQRMGAIIADLLTLARVSRTEIRHDVVDLTALATSIAAALDESDSGRVVQWRFAPGLAATGDAGLLRLLLENLLENAWKYTRRTARAVIEFEEFARRDGQVEFLVRDNGAGFDMAHADLLFKPFKRLHAVHEFEGIGVGLATVQRIVERHGGSVRAQAEVGKGASFWFWLPAIEGRR